MEMSEDGFLDELLALRREAWETNLSSYDHHQINGCFFSTNPWPTLDGLDSTTASTTTSLDCSSFLADPFSAVPDPPTFIGPGPEYSIGLMEGNPCKAEHSNIGLGSNNNNNNKSSKVKKVEGQPSKNLMAERRRRKRLNDRLSMLRSVVPKISKMDRTSILGDTIEYMKELLERIKEMEVVSNDLNNVITIFKDEKPNDVLVRNSSKFDVDRKSLDTRVEICCAGKPGLLLSTVTTLEALGLEIQQCVISCFNDFSLQASCFQEMEHKSLMSSEDVKQALFRNAGYGGRCL